MIKLHLGANCGLKTEMGFCTPCHSVHFLLSHMLIITCIYYTQLVFADKKKTKNMKDKYVLLLERDDRNKAAEAEQIVK